MGALILAILGVTYALVCAINEQVKLEIKKEINK